MFVNASELDVGFGRVGDDETIDDAFGYRLRHGMPQQILYLHGRHLRRNGIHTADDVVQNGVADNVQRGGRRPNDVRSPSVDESFQFRSGILDKKN